MYDRKLCFSNNDALYFGITFWYRCKFSMMFLENKGIPKKGSIFYFSMLIFHEIDYVKSGRAVRSFIP